MHMSVYSFRELNNANVNRLFFYIWQFTLRMSVKQFFKQMFYKALQHLKRGGIFSSYFPANLGAYYNVFRCNNFEYQSAFDEVTEKKYNGFLFLTLCVKI